MKAEKIIRRIAMASKTPELLEVLSAIPPTDLHSLLLNVYQRRMSRTTVRQVCEWAEKSRFTPPCKIDQRVLVEFDHLAYQILPESFSAIELSPLAPFGLNGVLARISQNNVLSTSRNLEISADPTSSLALVCAKERVKRMAADSRDGSAVRFATSHRVTRQQKFDEIKGFSSHFKTFCLATAGRDVGSERFEKEAFIEHLSFYLSLLENLVASGKYAVSNVTVAISDIRIIETLVTLLDMDRTELGRNTQNRSYSAFEKYCVNLPKHIESMRDVRSDATAEYKLEQAIELLRIAERGVVAPLKKAFPHVSFIFDLERIAGIGYYTTLCFKISAETPSGMILPLVDGGMSDWTQKILPSKKERALFSGIGSELLCNMFRII